MDKPLVSIISPCYNMEHCVGRLIESVIAQTYRPLEFIIVNDGSKDHSEDVIKSYEEKLKVAGISFVYHKHENKGLAEAINAGLKLMTGEYFAWPDADDYLEPTSVEERVVAFLEHEGEGIAVVTSDAYCRSSEYLDTYTSKISSHFSHNGEPEQFEYMLNGESIFCPGCHLVKIKYFLEVNPERHIYPCRRGQNWQLLLPLYFKYKRFFLDKPLYNYINWKNSMSKDVDTLQSKRQRYSEHYDILKATLQQIQDVQKVDMQKYIGKVDDMYLRRFMELAIHYKDRTYFKEIYEKKKRELGLDLNDRIANVRSRFPKLDGLLYNVSRLLRKVKII